MVATGVVERAWETVTYTVESATRSASWMRRPSIRSISVRICRSRSDTATSPSTVPSRSRTSVSRARSSSSNARRFSSCASRSLSSSVTSTSSTVRNGTLRARPSSSSTNSSSRASGTRSTRLPDTVPSSPRDSVVEATCPSNSAVRSTIASTVAAPSSTTSSMEAVRTIARPSTSRSSPTPGTTVPSVPRSSNAISGSAAKPGAGIEATPPESAYMSAVDASSPPHAATSRATPSSRATARAPVRAPGRAGEGAFVMMSIVRRYASGAPAGKGRRPGGRGREGTVPRRRTTLRGAREQRPTAPGRTRPHPHRCPRHRRRRAAPCRRPTLRPVPPVPRSTPG